MTGSPSTARSRRVRDGGTRDQLVVAAERLFAERGFDAVSLREIAVAAGTRNTGATQYYFGDKEELVAAVFAFRAPTLNARRTELLDAAVSSADPVRGALDALVRPLAEQIGTSRYVGFLARLQADHVRDDHVGAAIAADPSISASFRRCRRELERGRPELSAAVFRRRFRLVVRLSVAALADHERSAGHRRGAGRELTDLITDLLDASAGLLGAPTSR
jgi:AcrR family transcriptional regulator